MRLHRKPSYFVQRPIKTHVVDGQLINFVLQVRPENSAEGIHDVFELVHPHIALSSFAVVNICLKFIEAIVYLLMLSEELQLLPKSWHSLRKYGKDVLFFCKPS